MNIPLSRNGFGIHMNNFNFNATTSGPIIQPGQFLSLHAEVVAQCDKLDGVADGLIVNVRNFTAQFVSNLEPTAV